MARTRKANGFDEKSLTKMQLRKLEALRRSVGREIADKAFAEWLSATGGDEAAQSDRNAEMIAEAVMAAIAEKGFRIPRGGYRVRRGRGRVIVEPMAAA